MEVVKILLVISISYDNTLLPFVSLLCFHQKLSITM